MISQYHFPVYSRYSKRAKRISAYVKADGIEVVLPLNAQLSQATPLLDKHAAWFLQKWQELQATYQKQITASAAWPLQLDLRAIHAITQINIILKNNIYYLTINFAESDWQVYDSKIALGKKIPKCSDFVSAIQTWLKDFSYKVFLPRLNSISAQMALPYDKLQINLAKSCWGSCTSKKLISLNTSLLFFEPLCLDYVIIHECAHLKHMNHGRYFWQLVAHYCPNYVMMKNKLKYKSKVLPLWLYEADYLTLPHHITSMDDSR
jgi:predicted metal-dependent hydrolase